MTASDGGAVASVQIGGLRVEVDRGLLELFEKRAPLDAFLAAERAPLALRLRRVDDLSVPPIDAGPNTPAGVRLVDLGSEVLVAIPDDPFAAEAALRYAWYRVARDRGGLLLHSSGVVTSAGAVVAFGPSGAGKSTFARLMADSIGARLLSDEIVAIYPDATCHGSPFRSDLPRTGSPQHVRLRGLLTLVKGDQEQMTPVRPDIAVRRLLGQVYRAPISALGMRDVLDRLTAIVSRVPVTALTFRKEPGVGPFVEEWARASGADGAHS